MPVLGSVLQNQNTVHEDIIIKLQDPLFEGRKMNVLLSKKIHLKKINIIKAFI